MKIVVCNLREQFVNPHRRGMPFWNLVFNVEFQMLCGMPEVYLC